MENAVLWLVSQIFDSIWTVHIKSDLLFEGAALS